MIIPNYDNGTVNVHLQLCPKEQWLTKTELASRAFSYLTGLRHFDTETQTSFEGVEYDIFKTDTFPRIYVTCEESDVSDWCSIMSRILVKDENTRDVIVQFTGAVIGRFCVEEDLIPMIDFLYKYKDELMTDKSGVII
jgi:hypothetical protein